MSPAKNTDTTLYEAKLELVTIDALTKLTADLKKTYFQALAAHDAQTLSEDYATYLPNLKK